MSSIAFVMIILNYEETAWTPEKESIT